MPWFDRALRRRPERKDMVVIRSWPYRHPVFSAIAAAVLVGSSVVAWAATATPQCGPRLTAVGSPFVCVGLDQNSSPMRTGDPLADLENKVAQYDAKVTGVHATIVVLENMTPDPNSDKVDLRVLRHGIEGALTAVAQANDGMGAAGGTTPGIKLLPANFGDLGGSAPQAVAAIENAQSSDHIVAVTGIGQSLDSTRDAISRLSKDGITTVGADVTADDLNVDSSGALIQDFFRVAPTNSDEAAAAAQYIGHTLDHQHILLVADTNQTDIYAQTLATAFKAKFTPQYTETYESPDTAVPASDKQPEMIQQFADEHSDICSDDPDLIYFAGRGDDLGYFLDALENGSACPVGPLTIMTGDDANSLSGMPLPSGPFAVSVLFTALAANGEWTAPAAGSAPDSLLAKEDTSYQIFARAFAAAGFDSSDLDDGRAIMLHDAVYVAASATRDDSSFAVSYPSSMAATMLHYRCNSTLSDASGDIAFDPTTHNPVDKTIVVIRLNADGSMTEQSLEWPTGTQVDYFADTC
jgi:ABC-type branched-subunit amino acid transport system substrate-binding protein